MPRSRSRSRSRSKSPRRDKKEKRKKKDKKDKRKDKESRNDDKQNTLNVPEREPQERDGDETMSVEQTNALRAALGLEPLAVENQAVDNEEERIVAEEQKRRDEADKQQAETKVKRERIMKKKLEGATISEMYKSEVGSSAADWVKRSRKMGKDKALAAFREATLAADEEPEEYDSQHLKGLRVAHNSEQFQEGTGVILTLKDKPILKDGKLEDDDDVLENVNMVDDERDDKNNKIRGQRNVYDALDEENQDELLAQYADEKEKDGIRLTGEEDEASRARAAIRAKLKRSIPGAKSEYDEDDYRYGKQAYSLDFEKNVVPSDYAPVEFKKKKMRKKRKVRKAGGGEENPLAHIAEPGIDEHMADHASRDSDRRSEAEKAKEEASKKLKDQGYLKAIQKAEVDAKKVLDDVEHIFEDEDNAELQASMERARRLNAQRREERLAKKAAKKAKKASGMDDDEEEKPNKEEDRVANFAKEVATFATKMEDEEGKQSQVFTATTEFCRGLEQTMAESKTEKEGGFNEISNDVPTKEKKKDKKKKDTVVVDDDDDEDRDSDNMDDDDDDEDGSGSDEEHFGADEPRADGGIAQALELAKKRGLLKDKITQAGRSKDGVAEFEDPAPHIALQYLDEFGRPMKPKEAFRKLSHTFHGRGPGPVKLEKRLKAFREEQRKGAIFAGKRQTTLEKLQKKQVKSGQAFLVLDQKAMSEAKAAAVQANQTTSKK